MAKFYGPVGYVVDTETGLDIHTNKPVERLYRGDLVKNNRRLDKGEGVNDNVIIGNRISIVADAYAYEHIFEMRYVKWMGVCWKISNVDVERPRLILSLGGVYNGETEEEP